MLFEIAVAQIHADRVIRKWTGIGWEWDISVGGILGLRVGDAHRSTDFDEAEKFRREILMHADAAVGAWAVLDPAGVKTVGRLEFAPVGHRRAFEGITGRPLAELAFFHAISAVGVAVGVGASFLGLGEDLEVSGRGRGA